MTDNIRTLFELDAESYPCLHKALHDHGGAMLGKLSRIIEQFQGKPPPYTSTAGKQWYLCSFRYWANNYGGSLSTWNSLVHYCAALGLLELLKPTSKSIPAPMKQAWIEARAKKRPAELWYHVPDYTPEILTKAEDTIRAFKAEGINRTNLNKAAIIEALGQGAANHVYIDGRQMSYKEKAVERAIVDAIKDGITKHGYTTKAAVMLEARKYIVSKRRIMKKADAERKLSRVWENRNKNLLSRAKASYRRPTAEEKRKYNLSDHGWIITATS